MSGQELFVVGSLGQGQIHHRLVENFVEKIELARVCGDLYRDRVGFPLLVLGSHRTVKGQLLRFRNFDNSALIDTLWKILNVFHGVNTLDEKKSIHHLRNITALTEVGVPIQTKCYVVNPEKMPRDVLQIESGDWEESISTAPPLPSQLTERQISYLLKLGKSTGRDIVPINDLTLYRELMSMDLIVDKGRRLALSKFGQEVYRYLAEATR